MPHMIHQIDPPEHRPDHSGAWAALLGVASFAALGLVLGLSFAW